MARQLPILGQKTAPPPGSVPAPEDPEARPPWHWSGIGAVLVFATWLPLALLAAASAKPLLAALVPGGDEQADALAAVMHASPARRFVVGAAVATPHLLAFVVAAAFGGWLVGRFGGKAGPREASVAGLLAASTAWALTATAGGLAATWVLWPPVALVGTVASWLGGRLGKRMRSKA